MSTELRFVSEPTLLFDADTLVIVGRARSLMKAAVRDLLPTLPAGVWEEMVQRGDPGDHGRSTQTYTGTRPQRLVAVILPEACSRNNAPSRSWAITAPIRAAIGRGKTSVWLVLDEPTYAFAATLAVARAVPSYTAVDRQTERSLEVAVTCPFSDQPIDTHRLSIVADAIRFAGQLVDTPPNFMNTGDLVRTAAVLADGLPHVECTTIIGKELLHHHLGGLWGVGQASPNPPALIILDYAPKGAIRTTAWIGKGIVYDTGGLSLKTKTGMPGMKTDMAGAAAVLAAFKAAVLLEYPQRITAALCVAENAIGPNAMRPDDVIRLYSGKTIEINNTDAEGRLVLADGLAWVARNRAPEEMIDLATLTGAQLAATGKRHAAIYCNDEALESRALRAGRESGDLVHPLPYVPEFFRGEFQSAVADMKNSVKDRENAQSSCAGQFLAENLGDYRGTFLHVDMAGPAVQGNGRGSGFGVGLLLSLAGLATAPV